MNVSASGSGVRVSQARIDEILVSRWRCLRSHSTPSARTCTHQHPKLREDESAKNDRKYLLSQIDEIACVLVSLNASCANVSSALSLSLLIVSHSCSIISEYNICFCQQLMYRRIILGDHIVRTEGAFVYLAALSKHTFAIPFTIHQSTSQPATHRRVMFHFSLAPLPMRCANAKKCRSLESMRRYLHVYRDRDAYDMRVFLLNSKAFCVDDGIASTIPKHTHTHSLECFYAFY